MYRLALPPESSKVVFDVSKLHRYRNNPYHVIPVESVSVDPNLTFEERAIRILDWLNRALRRKVIPLTKVLRRSEKYEEATSQNEESMRLKFTKLFILGISLIYVQVYRTKLYIEGEIVTPRVFAPKCSRLVILN